MNFQRILLLICTYGGGSDLLSIMSFQFMSILNSSSTYGTGKLASISCNNISKPDIDFKLKKRKRYSESSRNY